MSDTITIHRPDDWHVHLRDGVMLEACAVHTARQFARGQALPSHERGKDGSARGMSDQRGDRRLAECRCPSPAHRHPSVLTSPPTCRGSRIRGDLFCRQPHEQRGSLSADGNLRDPNGPQVTFASEQFIDEIAAALGVEMMDIDGVLAESDFVSLHAVLHESTRNLINAERLAKAKPGIRIINAARGALIRKMPASATA